MWWAPAALREAIWVLTAAATEPTVTAPGDDTNGSVSVVAPMMPIRLVPCAVDTFTSFEGAMRPAVTWACSVGSAVKVRFELR